MNQAGNRVPILQTRGLTFALWSARIPRITMLKTIDIFIGLSLVMLLVSMIVTVITQVVTNVLNSRGKHLMKGVADILSQLHPDFTQQIAEEISTKVLTHPLVSDGKLAGVIHREELTK